MVRRALYGAAAGLVKAGFWLLGWRWLLSGAERLPSEGPAVLASNHVSYLDPLMVGYVADHRGRQLCFMAKKELFRVPGFGWLLRTLRMVPVDRAVGSASVAPGVAALRGGRVLAVFPESTITTSFLPAEGKTGAARMAQESGASLIPVACWGGQRLFTKHRPRRWSRGVVLAVRVGEPVPYEAGEDPTIVTKRLMDALSELVDQTARTYPQRPSGSDDLWWVPQSMGGSAPTPEEAAELRRRETDERRRRRERHERH